MTTALLNSPHSNNLTNNDHAVNNLQWCWVPVDKHGQETISLPPLEDTWVHLLSWEQDVLLLCSFSDSEWVVWNPDCGEQILGVEQFCVIPS